MSDGGFADGSGMGGPISEAKGMSQEAVEYGYEPVNGIQGFDLTNTEVVGPESPEGVSGPVGIKAGEQPAEGAAPKVTGGEAQGAKRRRRRSLISTEEEGLLGPAIVRRRGLLGM